MNIGRAVLPETYDIMANEVFLALHCHHIDESMNCCAAEVALTLPPCDVDDIDDAKLYLHCLVRWISLGIADNPDFQAYVDSNANGVIIPMQGDIINSQHIGWTKSSRLWLPLSEKDFVQIAGALVERFKQYLFAEHCWHALTRRHVGKELNKDMFALLIDSEIVTQKYQGEAYQRLSELSSKVTKGLDGDRSSRSHAKLADEAVSTTTAHTIEENRCNFNGYPPRCNRHAAYGRET